MYDSTGLKLTSLELNRMGLFDKKFVKVLSFLIISNRRWVIVRVDVEEVRRKCVPVSPHAAVSLRERRGAARAPPLPGSANLHTKLILLLKLFSYYLFNKPF